MLHLYATVVALQPFSVLLDPLAPAVLSAVGISTVSLLYTTLSFATNDRVSGKGRRVVLPAHLTQMFWYVCMVSSRVIALVLFAYLYRYYVVAVVGGHWLVMLFLLLLERTTFCADIERQSNGELRFTRRLCLEIPFDVLAAFVYVFAYFNPKRGRTRVWAGIYHVLTLAENVTMGVLFYFNFPSSAQGNTSSLTTMIYTVSGVALPIGLYVVGMAFMFCYYLIYHPKRTTNWHWIGFPRHCRCCCCKPRDEGPQDVVGTKYTQRNSGVVISGPTLVSHNGFVPKNLLPVGPNAVGMVNHNEVPGSTVGIPNGYARGEGRDHRSATDPVPPGRLAGGGGGGSGVGARAYHSSVDLESSVTIMSPNSTSTNTARTLGESNPVFSDFLASDTEFSSNPVEMNDTIIDTPLFGSTPDGVPPGSDTRHLHGTRIMSQDCESQKAYTNDTGIDVDSDLQLSPAGDMDTMDGAIGGVAMSKPAQGQDDTGVEVEPKLPVFVDVPVKHRSYKPGALERHYFPEQSAGRSKDHMLSASQEAPLPPRDSVTPTLPTPTYSPSPPPGSNRRQLSDELEDVFHRDSSSERPHPRQHSNVRRSNSGSQPSPDRPRRTPRSPIGARVHQVSIDDGEFSGSQRSTQTPTLPPTAPPAAPTPRAVTPRSPKGARRLLIQPSPVKGPPSKQQEVIPGRRQPPPPPRPPKSRYDGRSVLSESLPPVFTSSSSSSTGAAATTNSTTTPSCVSTSEQPPHRSNPAPSHHPRAPPSPPLPPHLANKDIVQSSDGLTRGLLSLVPANRRAHSSSPFPNSRQQVDTNMPTRRGYSRSVSYNPNNTSLNRTPRGTSNYKRSSVLESRAGLSGSVHSMQAYPHSHQRPKSEGWRMGQVLSPPGTAGAGTGPAARGRNSYHQTPLNSHGSSPDRTAYNSSDHHQQRLMSVSSSKSADNMLSTKHRPKSMYSKPGGGPYVSHIPPKSAFSRVSPERSHGHHIDGGRPAQRSRFSDSYPLPPQSVAKAYAYPHPSTQSPRHYPKAPQGAVPNAPKLAHLPPQRNMKPVHVPPPLPPPRRGDNASSIDKQISELSLPQTAADNRHSGNYDRLPADALMMSIEGAGQVGRANRNSFVSPSALHPPMSSAHESVV